MMKFSYIRPPSAFFTNPVAFIDVPLNTKHFKLVNSKHLDRPVQVKVSTVHVDSLRIILQCRLIDIMSDG